MKTGRWMRNRFNAEREQFSFGILVGKHDVHFLDLEKPQYLPTTASRAQQGFEGSDFTSSGY